MSKVNLHWERLNQALADLTPDLREHIHEVAFELMVESRNEEKAKINREWERWVADCEHDDPPIG